ncbi:MAG: NAD(P)-binding protein, partial [Deltaproteobacteria bacterium]|nr:NAD(P)-binding protein [Deltaproteobacteria bacterium]
MLYGFGEPFEADDLDIRKIGVIGAGPCGLSACKALEDAGLEYECLEASRSVGGVWNLESGATGAYRSLHTNTSTHAMAYSDFPFRVDSPRHLPAAELQEYF